MADENKVLAYLTDGDFVDFCKVAVLDAASSAVQGSPTTSGEATFALLATTDEQELKGYTRSLAKILVGNATVQANAAAGDPVSSISWNVFQTGAEMMLDEVWGPEAEKHPRNIPGTP